MKFSRKFLSTIVSSIGVLMFWCSLFEGIAMEAVPSILLMIASSVCFLAAFAIDDTK